MLYHLLYPLHTLFSPLNVFRYITFRSAYAVVTALLVCFFFGPPLIRRLRDFKIRQIIRHDGPQTHLTKSGTPTMGGILIVAGIIVPTLLWASLRNRYVLLAVAVTIVLGSLGFLDDYLHVVRSAEALLMVILGGAGTLLGPAIGAALIVLLENVISAYTQRWLLVLGAIYVVVTLLAPRGLVGLVTERWRRSK